MISRTSARFRECLASLPANVRRQASRAYGRFRSDPDHPSLRFKRLRTARPVWSVRISIDYRALGVRDGDVIVWFWVGSHADYDDLIARL